MTFFVFYTFENTIMCIQIYKEKYNKRSKHVGIPKCFKILLKLKSFLTIRHLWLQGILLIKSNILQLNLSQLTRWTIKRRLIGSWWRLEGCTRSNEMISYFLYIKLQFTYTESNIISKLIFHLIQKHVVKLLFFVAPRKQSQAQ